MEPSANGLTFEYHDKLNPLFWENDVLRPEIKEKLIDIAREFLDTLELDIDVEDAVFTGSLANYNYTKYSDVDLHIITDFNGYKLQADLLEDYFDAKKTNWNTKHDITLKSHDVEVYIQDIKSLQEMMAHKATGVYSIKTNRWLSEPVRVDSPERIDRIGIEKKKKTITNLIDYTSKEECDYATAKEIKEKILKMRQAGLEAEGEYSPENLAFKELRRTGQIERLIKNILLKKDKELSLAENTFKQMFSLSGGERGPRHRSLTAGVNRMTSPKSKTMGMIAKMHEPETPFPKVERLKAKKLGTETLTPHEAHSIANYYEIDLETAKTDPRGISTSGIKLSFNPISGMYILTKGLNK